MWSQTEIPVYDAKNDATDKESVKVNNDNNGDAEFWLNWVSSSSIGGRSGKSGLLKLCRSDNEVVESQPETWTSSIDNIEDISTYNSRTSKQDYESRTRSAKESLKAAISLVIRKWQGRFSFIWRHSTRILSSLWVSATSPIK